MIDWKLVPGIDIGIVSHQAGHRCDAAAVASDPANFANVIAAVGNFAGAGTTRWLSVFYSRTGGLSWKESALPVAVGEEIAGINRSTPVLRFGPDGTAYVLVLEQDLYISDDYGETWTARMAPWMAPRSAAPVSIAFACDPMRSGRLYVAWAPLVLGTIGDSVTKFARSDDNGKTWVATNLRDDAGQPVTAWGLDLLVVADGTLHLFGVARNGLLHWHSPDGTTFTARRVTHEHGIDAVPLSTAGPTACLAGNGRLVVAWPALRNQGWRIQYRATNDNGAHWTGPIEGSPLFPDGSVPSHVQHLRPQLRAYGDELVVCAFYQLRTENGTQRAKLMMAPSTTHGDDFDAPIAISDVSWSIPASLSHGQSLGRYFGLHPERDAIVAVWPDERSGTQTVYFDRVQIERVERRLPTGWHFDGVVVHRNSETWYTITLREGKLIVRRGPGVPPLPRVVTERLSAPDAPGELTRIELIEDPRILSRVSRAAEEMILGLAGTADQSAVTMPDP